MNAQRAEAAGCPTATLTFREEVVRSLSPLVEDGLRLLAPPALAWQPTDYLPDFTSPAWADDVAGFRAMAEGIPDDLLVVLVGDMVTEEALPSYSMALNGLVQDHEGTSPAPWARWLRGWTAEENRHGDLLNAYLRLTGRVDMRAVERTIQSLLVQGFTVGNDRDPYGLLVYTSFQERATRLTHAKVARLADGTGDARLARICRVIAGDEAKHETFYSRMTAHVLERDPEGGVQAMAAMLRRQMPMPGRLMVDGVGDDVYARLGVVAQRLDVYTAHDYATILDYLVQTWDVAGLSVSGEAARAQEEVCRAPGRFFKLAARVDDVVRRQPPVKFSWIFDRST